MDKMTTKLRKIKVLNLIDLDSLYFQQIVIKADFSLFLFGSHSKNRPNNIIIGRTFDQKILDMNQIGIHNLKWFSSISS